MPPDARQHAPATDRNRDPILAVLRQVLPPTGTVLEVASGTGQHAAFLAPQLAPRYWLPSEAQPLLRQSIRAWGQGADHWLPPLALDARDPVWPVEQPDWRLDWPSEVPDIGAIAAINLIHIAPWATCLGLLAGAGRILPAGGVLYLYGPYRQKGQHTAPSNAEFDRYLQSQQPEWGVRNLETVVAAADEQGLTLQSVIEMPANNLSVVLARR